MLEEFIVDKGIHQIKASAGSGKTYTLILVLLDLLKKNYLENAKKLFDGLLAITFTNVAASDLKDKLFERLKEIALGLDVNLSWSKEEAEFAVEALLADYSSINIRTIDSFLHLLLRQNRMDDDLPLNFQPAFNAGDFFNPLLDDLAKIALNEFHDPSLSPYLYNDYKTMYEHLYHDGEMKGFLGYEKIRQVVIEVCALLLPLSIEERENFATAEDIQKHMAILKNEFLASIVKFEESSKDLVVHVNLTKALLIVKEENLLQSSVFFEKNEIEEIVTSKNKTAINESMRKSYRDFQDKRQEVDKKYILLKNALTYAAVIPLAIKTLDLIQHIESSQEKVLSERIFLLLKTLVEEEENLAAMSLRMDSPLKYLLMDEFQDTNRIQWQVIEPFVKEALEQFDGLFTFVGDIKQAIYSWRGGDSKLFDEIIEQNPLGKSTLLDKNWRSKGKVVEFNNRVFGQFEDTNFIENLKKALFSDVNQKQINHIHRISHVFKNATQEVKKQDGGCVRIVEIEETKNKESHIEALKPHFLKAVKDLITRFSYKDIAVLVRDKASGAEISAWLAEEKIPLITEGSLLLANNFLVQQCISFLEWVNDPHNEKALWHIIGFQGILPISSSDDFKSLEIELTNALVTRKSLITKKSISLKELIEEDFPEIWEEIEPILNLSLCTPYEYLTVIIDKFKILQRFPYQSGYILKLLEYTFSLEKQGISHLAFFLQEWELSKEQESLPLPEGINAITIQTIHKAKGAQYPAVIVWNDCEKKTQHSSLKIYKNILPKAFISKNSLHFEDYYDEILTSALESLNLLYVAYTRAEEEMVILQKTSQKSPVPLLLKEIKLQCNFNEENKTYTFGSPSKKIHQEEKSTQEKILFPSLEYYEPEFDLSELDEHNYKESDILLPRIRGILFHKALEKLIDLQEKSTTFFDILVTDCVDTYPLYLTQSQKESLKLELKDILTWFSSLEDFPLWIKYGNSEVSVISEKGEEKRIDLLVQKENQILILDFKTGEDVESYSNQMQKYMELISQIPKFSHKEISALLCYVDLKKCVPIAFS